MNYIGTFRFSWPTYVNFSIDVVNCRWACMNFMKICAMGAILNLRKDVNEILPVFSTYVFFHPIWGKISIRDVHKNILNDCEFRENRGSENQRKCISVRTLHIECPIWVKFCIRNLRIML